jgi:hypothetical protein
MATPLVANLFSDYKELLKQAPPEILAQYSVDMFAEQDSLILSISENPEKVVNMVVELVHARTLELNNFVSMQAAVLRVSAMLPHSISSQISRLFVPIRYPTKETVQKLQSL